MKQFSSDTTRNAQHHLVANARVFLRLTLVAHAQRQQPHKLALEPAAHHAQPLRTRKYAGHSGADEWAAHRCRKSDEGEQGNALRVAQLQPNKRVEERLDCRKQLDRHRRGDI